MRRLMYILCIIGVLFVLGACTSQNDESEDGQKDVAETSIFKGKSEKAGSETSRHVELINVDGEKTGEATLTEEEDRKSTRLNSSHVAISYAVFSLKKKKTQSVSEKTTRICQPTNRREA